MNLKKCLLVLLFSSGWLLSANGSSAQSEFTLYTLDGAESRKPNPFLNGFGNLLSVTTEPLLLLDSESFRVRPWLVEDPRTSDSGLTWNIALRNGIEWSDGEPLDTADVKFTFDTTMDTGILTSSVAVELRSRIASVKVVDDLNFKIILREPDLRFPHKFLTARHEGTFHILPEHAWVGNTASYTSTSVDNGSLEPLLGSGPYVAQSVTATEATFVRNENWWGANTGFAELPKPEQIVVRFFETDDEAVEALKADEVDVGPEIEIEIYREILPKNSNIVTWNEFTPISWPSQCPRQLDFNTLAEPWDEPVLRKAVASYIDQSEIIATIFDGQNYPSPTLFSAQSGLEPFIQAIVAAGNGMSNTADLAAGDVLLAGAGFTKGADGIFEQDGDDLTLTIHVANEPKQDAEVAIAVGEMLTSAGIQTTVESVPGDELWAWIMPPGKFEAVYSWLSCASMVDPFASMRRYHPEFAVDLGVRSPGYQNMARWNTDHAVEYGALVDQIEMLAPGDPAIADLVVEAYGHLAAELPFIPIVQNPKIIPFSTSRWTGWPTGSDPYALPKVEWGQFNSIIHELEPAWGEK